MWAAASGFSQVTVPPALILTVLGRKHEFVSSQPGVDEPGAFVTVACKTSDWAIWAAAAASAAAAACAASAAAAAASAAAASAAAVSTAAASAAASLFRCQCAARAWPILAEVLRGRGGLLRRRSAYGSHKPSERGGPIAH